MMTIDLEAIPNQRTQFVADGQQYAIALHTVDDMLYMDVALNGTQLIYGAPCIADQQIIPYNYLEGLGGNFIFSTASGDNPSYLNFGSGDVLLYATNAELAGARDV